MLPLGGSRDRQDISELCNDYAVDTVFIEADALGIVFSDDMTGRFNGVRDVLFTADASSSEAPDIVINGFPHIAVHSFPRPSVPTVATSEY